MTRVYVGLDPGTRTGWAVLSEGEQRIASGVWNLERRRHDGMGMIYVRFEGLFRELLASYPGAVVAFEQQVNRFAGAAHIGAGIMSHIERICEETETPYTGLAFASVKRFATGKGNASKDAMVSAAEVRWGIAGPSDDEADALFIAAALRGGVG